MEYIDIFCSETRTIDDIHIAYRRAGDGPPLLLLHGFPQTNMMWHRIAPALAEHFTVIAADLRGYGDSATPESDTVHTPYTKRAMAGDMVGLMQQLGYEQFMVAGHDRGGRVAHRMARDHADRVRRLAILDIAPTAAMYGQTDMRFATAYYHWFFLIQPAPLPERMIGADPEFFLRSKCGQWGRTEGAITDAAFADYLRCFRRPENLHAMCEDYRAAATTDLDHDATDADSKLAMPVLALWGVDGFVGTNYDVLAEWQQVASDVSGQGVPGGHYLAEEAPDETLAALVNFFS
jgi:haloacetate dehalogenase